VKINRLFEGKGSGQATVRLRSSSSFFPCNASPLRLVSRLRQAGVPLGNIAELLGHKGLAMSKRYAHLSISNLHEAVSRIANSTPAAPDPVSEVAQVAYIH
jgi:hypothetical protein